MANIAVKVNRSVSGDGTRPVSGSFVEVGNSITDVDVYVQGGNALVAVDVDFAVADVKHMLLVADQNLTIETNQATGPDDTIELVANRPLEWSRADGYFPCPFTVDVSQLIVQSATGGRFKVKILR